MINRWRKLSTEERLRRHLQAIPRHVANSMAMEGEPVEEAVIRERLAQRTRQRDMSRPPSASDHFNVKADVDSDETELLSGFASFRNTQE